MEVLIFECDQRYFGVDAQSVREVVRAVALTPVPQAPTVVIGMVNLRGQVVPVLSTRRLLDLGDGDVRHTDHFIVVDAGGSSLALHVDRALDLLKLDRDAATADTDVESSRFVELVAKTHLGIVQVINPAKIFSDEALVSLRSIASSSSATELS
ncbi:MAG: purine-binding chemotaxis protein CheW [Pirellulaceae bacterium]|nr:purine-binding chemotaxis protein CheW [Pirellulaceae bacterium]